MPTWRRDAGRVLASCLAALAVGGCGGATSEATDSTVEGRGGGTDVPEQTAPDPKVEEAEIRCTKEIEKSELQPPDQLESIQVHACLFAAQPEIQACNKGPAMKVMVKIIIEKDGTVSNAFPVGDTADAPDAVCVAEVVKKVTFPKFKGQTQIPVKYPFMLGE